MASGSIKISPYKDTAVFDKKVTVNGSSSAHGFELKTNSDLNVTPTSTLWFSPLAIRDKNDVSMASIQFLHLASGGVQLGLYIKPTPSASAVCAFAVIARPDGTITYNIGDKANFKSVLGVS